MPARAGRSRPREPLLALLAAGSCSPRPSSCPPSLLARDAGRAVTGLANRESAAWPGVTGLVLRYVSHTPAPRLALAALPLLLTQTPVRVLGVALALCLALQWGRGPLSAPGALALVFDLTLCVLAGLSLSAQWRARREPRGRAPARLLPVRRARLGGGALRRRGRARAAAARRSRARWACWRWR